MEFTYAVSSRRDHEDDSAEVSIGEAERDAKKKHPACGRILGGKVEAWDEENTSKASDKQPLSRIPEVKKREVAANEVARVV